MENDKQKVTKRGRKPLPEEVRRKKLALRLAPDTVEYLTEIGGDNLGRAIDRTVVILRDELKLNPKEVKN